MYVNRNFLGKLCAPPLSVFSSGVINLCSIYSRYSSFEVQFKDHFLKNYFLKKGKKKKKLFFKNNCIWGQVSFEQVWIKMAGNIQKIVLVFALITSPKGSIKLSSYRGIYSYLMNVMQRLNFFLFRWLLFEFFFSSLYKLGLSDANLLVVVYRCECALNSRKFD